MRCPRQLRQNLLLHLLNSIWLQFARSTRDQSNRRFNTFTESPAWAWPTPRRRWTSPTADIERTYRPACSAGGPPLSWWWERRLPIPRFPSPEDCFRPPANIEEFVSFDQEEGDDSMSISASEREDWAGLEPDQLDSSGPSGLQEELMRVLSKAVQELELTWSPPE